MKYKMRKKTTNNPDNHNQIFIRLKDSRSYKAFLKAMEDSHKSRNELAVEMIEHCLKESGYLNKTDWQEKIK